MSTQAEDLKEFKKLLDDGVITKEEFQMKKEEILGRYQKEYVKNDNFNPFQYYGLVLQKYATFEGRARRKEYWSFYLVNVLIGFCAMIFMGLSDYDFYYTVQGFYALYSLAILIPGIAVTTRRLHDIGESGWWILIGLFPIVGNIILFIYLIRDGDPDTNMYGASPKEI